MTRIQWDQKTEKYYETGIDRVVLYKITKSGENAGDYEDGVPWNGFTGLTESPSGAEETALYANNGKYLSLYSNEEFGGTMKAYTYPDEWEECDGSALLDSNIPGVMVHQQNRSSFGLTYRTKVGNDTAGEDYSYKIHLVYNATASPSSKDYQTINDSPEAIEFSWDFKTVPIDMPNGMKRASRITIDKNELSSAQLTALENALYGVEGGEGDPYLPTPTQLVALLAAASGTNGATGSTGATGTTGA